MATLSLAKETVRLRQIMFLGMFFFYFERPFCVLQFFPQNRLETYSRSSGALTYITLICESFINVIPIMLITLPK